jgi:hypothetical protein
MDILQCVGGSLSLIVLLVPVTRNARVHRFVCVALAIAALVSVDAVSRWAPGATVPRPLLSYLWPKDVGLFPLVPWAAFPLLGVWLGPAIFSFTKRTWEQGARAALAGIVFMIAARFVPGSSSYDAQFVFARIGWILLGLVACCWLGEPVRGTRWILEFGQLSLWSYTVHLILVYGSGVSLGLDALRIKDWSPVRDGLPPWATLVSLAIVLVLTALVVRWRAKSLQRKAAIRMMPAK